MRKNYIAGKWIETKDAIEVRHPYDNEVIDAVPAASEKEVSAALDAAERGAKQALAMGAHARYTAVLKAADIMLERADEFADAIMMENGKPLADAQMEAERSAEIVRLSAFEGAMLRGEQLPYESASNGAGRMGMTLRVPCGIVVAITPFNFPVMLAVHKIGPALTTGNAVILKPASVTPLSSVLLTEVFHEAGFEGDILQLITGAGGTVGTALASDPRPRKISFTGSMDVGLKIASNAGLKKLSLELGSNCPMVVLADADVEEVAKHVGMGGYANAGQVCISLQRAIVDKSIYNEFLEASAAEVNKIKVGAPKDADTKMASMISESEATRVESWVEEAAGSGARVMAGGDRDRATMQPTLVADVKPDMRLACDEVFGPVVAAMPVDGIDEAIALANNTDFGLSASIFTTNVKHAMRFAREAESGNIQINWSPQWRADFMPYGGLKGSGIGKEGMRYACHEMTEEKAIAFHGID